MRRRLRRPQPKLRLCVLGDALYSPGPTISLLRELRFAFLLAVKPRSRAPRLWTYEAGVGYPEAAWPEATAEDAEQESVAKDRGPLRYRILHRRPLNASHPDWLVTVLQGERLVDNKWKMLGEWVTNQAVTPANVASWVRQVRRRWQIETGVFRTMKAQKGLNFEPNFGHGKTPLCDNFGVLMVVVALMAQRCLFTCDYFRKVRALSTAWERQWERQRVYLGDRTVSSWKEFYLAMLGGLAPPGPEPPETA